MADISAIQGLDGVTYNLKDATARSSLGNYVLKSGDTMTGALTIKRTTVATNTYADANPKIIFSNSDASQNVSLTFSDYDSVQAPASLTLNGNQGGEYFITPNIKATQAIYATNMVNANSTNSASNGGLSLYGNVTDYGIAFRTTANQTKHGGVQGDWAQYHFMTGATNRGWVFKHTSGAVASIDAAGDAVFNGYVTIGGNTANTSGCKQQYNTTTQALDFIFS